MSWDRKEYGKGWYTDYDAALHPEEIGKKNKKKKTT
jgi:hypothetical protein